MNVNASVPVESTVLADQQAAEAAKRKPVLSKPHSIKRLKVLPVEHALPYGIKSKTFTTLTNIPVALDGPYKSHTLSITYSNDPETVDSFIRDYPSNHYGFDLEHRPTYKPGQKPNVSLLQLAPSTAGTTHPVLIYSLFHNNGIIPTSLVTLLHSETIQKYGVGIKGDVHNLKFMNFSQPTFRSFIDLSPLALNAKYVDRSGVGLKTLIMNTMGEDVAVYKTKSLTMTNWELLKFSEAQIRYAALDAFCGIEIWRLIGLRLADNIAESARKHNQHVPRVKVTAELSS